MVKKCTSVYWPEEVRQKLAENYTATTHFNLGACLVEIRQKQVESSAGMMSRHWWEITKKLVGNYLPIITNFP